MQEERRLREQEMVAERERREREEEKRTRAMQEQMDAIMRIVEATRAAPRAALDDREGISERDLKLCTLTEANDIEAYLTTFERMMEAYEIDKARWVFKLAPQLSGKAQQTYSTLPTGESNDYDLVKAAVFRRYNVNEETYRVL